MMRKEQCAGGLLAVLLVIGAVGAQAQTLREFPCQIDLGEREGTEGAFQIEGVPEEFRRSFGASTQTKVCQGKRNVRVTCNAFIPDWPFNRNFNASDLTCCINTQQCGIMAGGEDGPCGSLAEARIALLQITATQANRCGPDSSSCGLARLECRLN
jgi:hypothetical protein